MQDWNPLFENSRISRKESEFLIMAMALRHNWSLKCLENHLALLDLHFPEPIYKSKHNFLKSFPKSNAVEYFYCCHCEIILTLSETNIYECSHCNNKYEKKKLKSEGLYFLYIPLRDQIINFFNSQISEKIVTETDNCDVINSRIYRYLKENNIIGNDDLTIQFNVDGVNYFKSSKKSLWPILVTINELPYRIRKNNVILCGLWEGIGKPKMNLYLQPFVDELVELQNNGLHCTRYNSNNLIELKIHPIICSIDSVARPMVLNMAQYNGKFGCTYCYHKGEIIVVGKGHARVYVYAKKKLRNKTSHDRHVKKAIEQDTIIKGVKGVSIISLLSVFDITKSFPPDYLHSCLLGVGKLFIESFFDSKYNDKEFYIGNCLEEFNKRLRSIKPPSEITRIPQPITNKLKASEWKNFILYYSIPCLNDLLKPKYLKHWNLFVIALHIFLREKIPPHDFEIGKSALKKFVIDIEKLYGKEFMKYNIHLLTHIPEYILNYGALWAWSAFPFESYNSVIKHLFSGTQCIPDQICKSYCLLTYIKNNSHVLNDINCDPRTIQFFHNIMNQCHVKNSIIYEEDVRVFGKGKKISLTRILKFLVEQLLNTDINEQCLLYSRFIYKNILFHTESYTRMKKRNNCTVMLNNNLIVQLTHLLSVTLTDENKKFILLGTEMQNTNEIMCRSNNFSSASYSYVMRESDNIRCFNLSDLNSKCIKISFNENLCYTIS